MPAISAVPAPPLALVAAPCPAAFAAALAAAAPQLRRAAARAVPAGPRADELAQEALLRAWQLRGTWRGDGDPGAFAHGILRNLIRNDRRRRRELPLDRLPPAGAWEADPAPAALDRLLGAERDGAVQAALGRLPADEALVLRLRYAEDLGQEQIDAALGQRPGQARAALQRGRRRLRALLAA